MVCEGEAEVAGRATGWCLCAALAFPSVNIYGALRITFEGPSLKEPRRYNALEWALEAIVSASLRWLKLCSDVCSVACVAGRLSADKCVVILGRAARRNSQAWDGQGKTLV